MYHKVSLTCLENCSFRPKDKRLCDTITDKVASFSCFRTSKKDLVAKWYSSHFCFDNLYTELDDVLSSPLAVKRIIAITILLRCMCVRPSVRPDLSGHNCIYA